MNQGGARRDPSKRLKTCAVFLRWAKWWDGAARRKLQKAKRRAALKRGGAPPRSIPADEPPSAAELLEREARRRQVSGGKLATLGELIRDERAAEGKAER